MARQLKLATYDFNPRNFRIASLADVLAASDDDPPYATIQIGHNKNGPKLKPSDEVLSGVPVNQKVRWQCTLPFRLTFGRAPDAGKSKDVKFDAVREDDFDGLYAIEIPFKGLRAESGAKVTIEYEIQVKIDGKWLGKDPSVIIDTTKASAYVLVPRSARFDPAAAEKPAELAPKRSPKGATRTAPRRRAVAR